MTGSRSSGTSASRRGCSSRPPIRSARAPTRRRRRRSSAPATRNQNGPNRQFAKGLSRFHTPHRFTLNGSWRMPFFAGRSDLVGQVFGGWQLSGVMRLASGTPFSVIDTSAGARHRFRRLQRIEPSGDGRSVGDRGARHRSRHRDADAAARGIPHASRSPTTTTTSRRATGSSRRAPRTWTWRWPRTSGCRTQGHVLSVRIEAFNAFNTVKFGFPVNDIANVNFGRLTGAATDYSARVLQFVLRYRY